ncbi:MAG: hypothetical protein GY702_16725 [Desulfobulbaceae bacterium]|nr:hypothetical protein [Desulfobulbaceae bacterium]
MRLYIDSASLRIGCFLVTMFLSIGTAQAKINIEALVTTGWEYNTNFWRAETDETAVDTFYIKPGVALGYDTAKSKIEAKFTLEPYWYSDRDTPQQGVRDASEDNFVGYAGHFFGETQATDRLALKLSDRLYRTRDAAQSDTFSNSVSRDLYTINYLTPSLYYDFGNKFGLGIKYRNTITEYSTDLSVDSKENRGVADLFYNFNSRSSLFLSYNVWERKYDKTISTYLSNKLSLNFVRQFHYFSVDVGGGYHHRSFDEDDRDNLDLFAWHIIIDGQKPAAPARSPRAYMKLVLKQDYNDAGTNDQYYIATQLDAEVGYLYKKKIQTILKAYFQNSDYQNDPANRSDDTYSVSGLVSYRFWEHGKVKFEVGYRQRESSLFGNDYDDTFTMLSLDFGHDFGSK